MMERFAKLVDGKKPLIILVKRSVLWEGYDTRQK